MAESPIVLLKYKTFIKALENAPGTRIFNTLYAQYKDSGEVKDICEDASYSCAYFVSSMLTIMGLLTTPVATVSGVNREVEKLGWKKVDLKDIQPGDIIFWEKKSLNGDTPHSHVGFYLGNEKAVSTNWQQHQVIEHHVTYGKIGDESYRAIEQIVRPPLS